MNLEQLLNKEMITRKEFIEAGFNDYEIKKLVDQGILTKVSRGVYKNNKSNNSFLDLVTSFNNHDSEAVARIYDSLLDKDKYNSDIIKLMLISLSRIENILSNGYELKRENKQPKIDKEEERENNDDSKNSKIEETVITSITEDKEENINDVIDDSSDLKMIEDDISYISEDLEITKDEVEENIIVRSINEEDDNFDINLFLDDLYCEYKNAIEQGDYYKARDILLEYEKYCNKYNLYNDCFYDLFKIMNKINLFIPEEKKVADLVKKIKSNLANGHFTIDLKSIKKLLDEFRDIPNYNDIYFYHDDMAYYYFDLKVYPKAIEEFEKAIEINPYNKYDYYKLAYLYFISNDSKVKLKKSLNYINEFSYYSNNQFKPSELALLISIYLFNFKFKESLDILSEVEKYDSAYQTNFYNRLFLTYTKKYEKIITLQDSNILLQRQYAHYILSNEFLDVFMDYILSLNCDCKDLFVNNANNERQEFINAKKIIDSSEVIKLNKLDQYLFSLDFTDDINANLLLEVSLYLAEKGFTNKSRQYLEIVEKMKDKSKELKSNYNETKVKIKIRNTANKNRR